jgi:hypothetical protein
MIDPVGTEVLHILFPVTTMFFDPDELSDGAASVAAGATVDGGAAAVCALAACGSAIAPAAAMKANALVKPVAILILATFMV